MVCGSSGKTNPAIIHGRGDQIYIGMILAITFFKQDHPLYVCKVQKIFVDPIHKGTWLRVQWFNSFQNRWGGTYTIAKHFENLLLENRIQGFKPAELPKWELIHWS